MTRAAKQRLNDAYIAYTKAKHPTLPDRALMNYRRTDNNANGLTACIKDWLKFHGCQAERVNNMGRISVRKNRFEVGIYGQREVTVMDWQKGTGRKGTADIHATIPVQVNGQRFGLSVKLEVKYGKDRQSKDQREYQAEIEATGGRYYIVKNFDQFLAIWDDLRKEFSIFGE